VIGCRQPLSVAFVAFVLICDEVDGSDLASESTLLKLVAIPVSIQWNCG